MGGPTFFARPAQFRRWLERHHERETELLVGFYKTGSGKPSITWPQSVDEALCFGWIDGVRRRIDDESYSIRFTPRKPTSTWSAVNIRRMGELVAAGLVAPAGLAAFERRSEKRSAIYSYERRNEATLEPALERELRRNRGAATYLEGEAPWYRRTVTHWVMSAKREETRRKRLAELIEASAAGRRIKQLTPNRPETASASKAGSRGKAKAKAKG
jgi:uncharacterized protein YdeI (YjbR/CyaY-like superfamily)